MRATKAIVCLACGLFAACGKDHALTDAGASDADTADAGNAIDADLHGPVTVTVMNTDGVSGPEPGVMVAFIDPDGTVVKEIATDANGKATADVLAGASVTAVYVLAQTQHQIESILGVKPGDDLTIGTMHPDTSSVGTFTVNVIDVSGSTEYDVFGPCGETSYNVPPPSLRGPHPLAAIATIPITLTMTNDCVQPTMDLVAIRYDNTGGTSYVELADTAFTSGGAVTQVAGWQSAITLTGHYDNVPADVSQIYPDVLVPDQFGYEWSTYAAPTSGSATATFTVPFAKRALIKTNYGGQHNGSQWVDQIADGNSTAYTVDIGASLLPWIEIPTMDFAAGVITTASTGSGGPGDAFQVTYSFSRTDPNGISGSAMIDVYDWTIWAPTLGDITVPKLPADLADNDPAAGDTDGGGSAKLGDLDLAAGYDDVRAHLDAAYDAYENSGRGAIGTLRLSTSVSLPVSFTRLFHPGAPRR